jgi:hypothetical protein
MNKADQQEALWFFGGLSIIAVVVNTIFSPLFSASRQPSPTPSTNVQQNFQQQAHTPIRPSETNVALSSPPPVDEAVAQHTRDLTRYVNTGFSREPGMKAVAIVAVSEDGAINDTVGYAVDAKIKSGTVETIPAFFTPEFVSDGLFGQTFGGSRTAFARLDLAKSLDAMVLARESIQYSADASLNDLVTASVQLDVKLLPVGASARNRSWSLTASGAGFKREEARRMAEERLIKQIGSSTNMSFTTSP